MWASPGWLAGWLVAIGLPVLIMVVASRFIPDHGPKALAGWAFLFLVVIPLAAAFIFQDVPGAFDWYGENVMPAYDAIKHLLSGPVIGPAELAARGRDLNATARPAPPRAAPGARATARVRPPAA